MVSPVYQKLFGFRKNLKTEGAWFFIKDHLEQLIKKLGQELEIHYKGRQERAASAEGSEKAHKIEQEKIIKNCISSI